MKNSELAKFQVTGVKALLKNHIRKGYPHNLKTQLATQIIQQKRHKTLRNLMPKLLCTPTQGINYTTPITWESSRDSSNVTLPTNA